MDHRQSAAQFAVPADKRMGRCTSVFSPVAVVTILDDVKHLAGRVFAGIVFGGKNFAVRSHRDPEGIPETFRHLAKITPPGTEPEDATATNQGDATATNPEGATAPDPEKTAEEKASDEPKGSELG